MKVKDRSLFRGQRAGENRGRDNDYYAGKKGGHINLCTHVRELWHTKMVPLITEM